MAADDLDDVTLGEVYRLVKRNHDEARADLEEVSRNLRRDLNGVGTRVETLSQTFVSRELFENTIVRVAEDMNKMQASVTWAWRTAIAGVVLPIVVALSVFLLLEALGPQPSAAGRERTTQAGQ